MAAGGLFVEGQFAVFPEDLAEAMPKRLGDMGNFVRHLGHAPQSIAVAFERNIQELAGAFKETFNVFRHQAVLAGTSVFTQDALQVNIQSSQPFQ
jgi:hypothetical protein